MGDPVVVESWHLPRALSDEALRLLTSLPMEEIELRLRMDGPAGHEKPTDEQLDALFFEIVQSGESQSWRTFARAVLARWGAADGDLLPAKPPNIPSTMAMQYRSAWREGVEDGWNEARAFLARLSRPAVPPASLRQQALRPVPVSERLPGPEEMTDDQEVWVLYPGQEYPLGDTGDYDWDPHKWILSPIAKSTIRENRRWLPAHALPLPEVE